MGLKIEYIEGQTPLDEDEKEGLRVRTISTRGELDEFEQLNIQSAIEWSLKTKVDKKQFLTEDFLMLKFSTNQCFPGDIRIYQRKIQQGRST